MSLFQSKLSAGSKFPTINVKTFDGGEAILGKPQNDATWQLVVIYRGQHCPLCSKYLNELASLQSDFSKIGIDIIAASADSEAQLRDHFSRTESHHLENINFPIGYGLTLADLKILGLYVSEPRSEQETDHQFPEPGLFVVNEEGNIQVIDISNSPFTRPDLRSLLGGLTFVRSNNYPIRGTVEL